MSRTLLVGLVLFGSLAVASAQEPNDRMREVLKAREERLRAIQAMKDAERLAVQEQLLAVQAAEAEQLWSNDRWERWVFRQDGNSSRARQRLDSLLVTQIGNIEQTCTLTDAQKAKLHLAGRGDIKRFFDRYEIIKRKSQAIQHNQQNFQEIQQELDAVRLTLQAGLFDESSFLFKVLPNTLTSEQLARYDEMVRERRAARQRGNIERVVGLFQRSISLRDAQRRQLITLMTNETKLPLRSGPNDYYVLLLQLCRLPEEKLKPLFDEPQWMIVSRDLARWKRELDRLKQSGQLPDEDD